MRTLSVVLLTAILFSPAHLVAGQTNSWVSTRMQEIDRAISEKQLKEQQSKLEQLRQRADELRQSVGLPPVNLEKTNDMNSVWQWQQLQDAREGLRQAQARLKTAESMSPQERDIASKLYVPSRNVLSESITNITRNGDWLLKTIQKECWAYNRIKDVYQDDLGITDEVAINISEQTARQLDQAERDLEVQRRIMNTLKTRATTQQPQPPPSPYAKPGAAE